MTEETRKKQFKDRIIKLARTAREPKEPTKEEFIRQRLTNEQARAQLTKHLEQIVYVAAVHQLKEFVVDRDCKGEPLQLMVSSAYTDPVIDKPEDRMYLATYGKTPDYEQVVFEQLKKYHLVYEDCQLSDYSFLFPPK
jgi:hypothetical protein